MARVRNIVLINEHPVDQAVLRYFLSSQGVASISLSPRAGLDALAAMAPDLVVLDAAQGCSGVRKRLPKARIIAVCDDDALVAGADAVLRKPLDFQRLNQDLRPLLRDPAGDATGARRRVLIIDDGAGLLASSPTARTPAGCVAACGGPPAGLR